MKTRTEFFAEWKKEWQADCEIELKYFTDENEPITADEREKAIATINYINENFDMIVEEFYKFDEYLSLSQTQRIYYDVKPLLQGYELDEENDIVKFVTDNTYFRLYEADETLFMEFITREHDFAYEISNDMYFDRDWFKSEIEAEEKRIKQENKDWADYYASQRGGSVKKDEIVIDF